MGDIILGAYKRRRLSQADLVERTGISVTTMRRLIAGEAEFDVDQLVTIANALGVPAAGILSEAEEQALGAKREYARAAISDPELDADESPNP